MLRSTLMALAIMCALSCFVYAQEPAAKPQTPAPAANQNAAAMPMQPPATPPPPPPMTLPSTSVVPMTEPVITLKGACEAKAGTTSPPGCVSSMTREQFEKLVKALTPPDRPQMPVDMMRNFATQYSKLLIFADAAREMGMENDPKVQEIMQFAQNQILREALTQHITEEYSHPSDQQIEDYYKENSKKYVEATLQRIIIPRNQGNMPEKPKPSEADEKAFAEQLQKRWVAGEDP